MNRLTKRVESDIDKGVMYVSRYYIFLEGEIGYEEADKLAEYEDAEEQGLLLKLPCAVGDTVYQCMIVGADEKRKPIYKVFAAKVFKYSLDSYTLCFWTETKDDFKYRNEMPLSAFGEFVFLTREEAEAALERMG